MKNKLTKDPNNGKFIYSVEAFDSCRIDSDSPYLSLRRYKAFGGKDDDGTKWVIPDKNALNKSNGVISTEFKEAKETELKRLLDIQETVNNAIKRLKSMKASDVSEIENPY